MRRLRELDRSTAVDLVLTGLAIAAGLPLAILRPDAWPDVGSLTPVLLVAGAAGLLIRRRHPVELALGLCAAVAVAPVATVPLLVALYTVGARVRRSVALTVWAVAAAETVVLQVADDGTNGLSRAPVIALALGFPLVLGMAMEAHRRLMAEMVDRAERAEREQDLLAEAAVAAERARLARELHDVVAHRVSLMVLHASALELAPATPATSRTAHATTSGTGSSARPDPTGTAGTADTAAEAALIGSIGRQALDELRQMLDVLRDGRGDEVAPRAPLPGVPEIHDLAAASRATGLTVTVTEDGDVASVPGPVGRTAFRVVQEALTNVHKHARGAAVVIRLRRLPARLDVEVVNHQPDRAPLDLPGGGHGLAGLRERVALAGGQVVVGPTPGGGWAVHAQLPVSPPTVTTALGTPAPSPTPAAPSPDAAPAAP